MENGWTGTSGTETAVSRAACKTAPRRSGHVKQIGRFRARSVLDGRIGKRNRPYAEQLSRAADELESDFRVAVTVLTWRYRDGLSIAKISDRLREHEDASMARTKEQVKTLLRLMGRLSGSANGIHFTSEVTL